MKLSNELISRFVKATMDEPDKKQSSTVYATVQGSSSIKIDGSDTVIPVDGDRDSSTKISDGDRVTVMIKDHNAVVTGNLTKPSATNERVENVNTTVEGFADEINSAKGNITELYSNIARIATIEADKVTIHDELIANNVTVKNLTSDVAELKEASVGDLTAINADITNLKSDMADINTLIFGSAAGDVIQTSFSNAVIAQLGDAQIKSAMIESIVTNDVEIKSNDGRLIISDETIQISDENRVRVQIGKDEANDYSINIWDQNGNLMFSEGGITDAAIKDAIIRNDMVAENANISSYKVYLDEEGKTLDVAFKSLETTVNDQGETITSHGAIIEANQEAISTKVWQQDINTAKNELSTQYSTLQQDVSGFKTTVANTYATKNAVNAIVVGGRNFIVGSRDLNGTASTNYNSKVVLDNGFTAFKCTGNWHGVKRDAKDLILDSKDGDPFTFSLNIKTSDTCKMSFYAMCYTADKQRVYPVCTSGQFNSMSIITTNAAEEKDQRVSITFPVTQGWIDLINDGGTIDWTLQVHDGASSTNPAYLYAPKLERGNKPTDWTPAPEDAESKITANKTLIEQTATDLTAQIESSAKTATNYLNFSSSGLVVGDLTASTLGKNILIDSDSVDIRSGTNVRASFGEDYLYLAKHSRNAKIDLCNGLVELYHASSTSYDTIFVIDTPNITKIKGTYNPLLVESTVSGKTAIQFANTNGVLGSIGMVESASGAMITRNVPSTASTYTVLDTGNFYTMMDSGWLTCAINTSGNFTVYDDGSNIKYRKIGKMVEVVGAVKPKTTLTGGTTNYVFATLPSGYRPALAITERCQGSGGYSWLFSITTGGELRYSRYSNGSSCVDLPAQTWLPFHAIFFTN